MSATSVSELILTASVYGRGQIRAKVFKHLSPVTLGKIQRSVPFGGNANFFERNFVYILTPVVGGEEKSRKEFSKGSLAFMPAGCMLCFFIEDTRSYKPMNPLGEIVEGLDILSNLKRGDSIRVESITAPPQMN
jgi:hypothetical protein